MKSAKQKRWMGSLIAGAALLLVVGVVASCGPRIHHGERFLKHLDSYVEDLELNGEQQKQYRALREDLQKSIQEHRKSRKESFAQMKAEMKKETPDVKAVGEILKKQSREVPGTVSTHVDRFVSFYNSLDESQKRLVNEEILEKMDRMERHMR